MCSLPGCAEQKLVEKGMEPQISRGVVAYGKALLAAAEAADAGGRGAAEFHAEQQSIKKGPTVGPV
jgi:hypothetical protein